MIIITKLRQRIHGIDNITDSNNNDKYKNIKKTVTVHLISP